MLSDAVSLGTAPAASPALSVKVDDRLSPDEMAEVMEFVAAAPSGSYLQRPDWPLLCPPPQRHSYRVLRAFSEGRLVGTALVRLSPLGPGVRLAFAKRGPVTRRLADLQQVVPAMARALRRMGACTLVMNPRWQDEEATAATALLQDLGATVLPPEGQSIHRATLLVDLAGSEDDLQARLKARCRRQIGKCEKMGLQVKLAETLEEAMLLAPVLEGFHRRRRLSLESTPSVERQWQMTRDRGGIFLGYFEGRVICGHSVIADGDRAFWLSLASTDEPQDMPRNYALVWAALRHAQAQGFRWYDMAGAPTLIGTDGLGAEEGDGGQAGRNQFKTAFSPVHAELVPMMVLPLSQPTHALFFGLRQRLRGLRARRKAGAS